MAVSAEELGTQDIKKLLIKQAVPASIGILFMSVNILIDTIFVGQWIGSLAIAAVTVVLPITFFISSLGMAIGVGGGFEGSYSPVLTLSTDWTRYIVSHNFVN